MAEDFNDRLRNLLMEERDRRGIWRGELSPSALATATALTALAIHDANAYRRKLERGAEWLSGHQNFDGGWGDSPESPSNLPTTLLSRAALVFLKDKGVHVSEAALDRSRDWTAREAGGLSTERLTQKVIEIYGKDATFSAPILAMAALCGLLDEGVWKRTPRLPFEVALMPRGFWAALRLPVVSYALPALVAVGRLQQKMCPKSGPQGWLRNYAYKGTVKLLSRLQPENGGYLEAIPLTAFVCMSLSGSGDGKHAAAVKGREFLCENQHQDGSWKIDTSLELWLTSMACASMPELDGVSRDGLSDFYLSTQFEKTHPFTGAKPGGWAWSADAGGVPDADDTAGALIALAGLTPDSEKVRRAAEAGLRWLADLQNSDGGVPTFCRGWGNLPFDRSCPDITAHAFEAHQVWYGRLGDETDRLIDRFCAKAMAYLNRVVNEDGSYTPLWFGNQYAEGKENRIFGTARVLLAVSRASDKWNQSFHHLEAGIRYLLSRQLEGGGFTVVGKTPNLEETALALAALSRCAASKQCPVQMRNALSDALTSLVRQSDNGQFFPPSPVGLYFSSLWYSERLYPILFSKLAMSEFLQI